MENLINCGWEYAAMYVDIGMLNNSVTKMPTHVRELTC